MEKYLHLWTDLEYSPLAKHDAAWRSQVSRQPHKLEVVGSNPTARYTALVEVIWLG